MHCMSLAISRLWHVDVDDSSNLDCPWVRSPFIKSSGPWPSLTFLSDVMPSVAMLHSIGEADVYPPFKADQCDIERGSGGVERFLPIF